MSDSCKVIDIVVKMLFNEERNANDLKKKLVNSFENNRYTRGRMRQRERETTSDNQDVLQDVNKY